MGIQVESLAIPDVKLISPDRFLDDRGFFSETYNTEHYRQAGVTVNFIQDNHSFSEHAGTIRGLHYQAPPKAQAKLVRVLRGSILDVAVDIRTGSPTYGKWVSAVLSADNGRQLYVPPGFLHGFATREPNTDVAYKVDHYYSKACDGAILWDDPTLAIDWELDGVEPVLSDKDRTAPIFANFKTPF